MIPLYCLVGRCPTCIPFDGSSLRARGDIRYQENPEIGANSRQRPGNDGQGSVFAWLFSSQKTSPARIREGGCPRRRPRTWGNLPIAPGSSREAGQKKAPA
ncbi:hypothetical protein DESPIGER_1139 [Desulfovibrio piger]|uniref:Uncharacterized protein n=1 Tax=Desulfovibrio piger TaxID=901 RepID=A0A1K1LE68_9BACT|nr:hypothetical protein DESPIGER_1139 [Desulfovibrio piger]